MLKKIFNFISELTEFILEMSIKKIFFKGCFEKSLVFIFFFSYFLCVVNCYTSFVPPHITTIYNYNPQKCYETIYQRE